MQQRQAGCVPHARLHTQETEENVHTGLHGVSPPWAPPCCSLYCRVLRGGVAGGGDILQVIGDLALSSGTAFTHRVLEMAFDWETFLDITQCPLGTKVVLAEKH